MIDPITAIASERWVDRCRLGGEPYLRMYWEATDDAHRGPLLDAICDFDPATVLEVGCHVGVNLRLFNARAPGRSIAGVDISPDAIDYARAAFWDETPRPAAIDFRVGSAVDLAGVAEADVVFACYALAYLAPDDIFVALRRMWALARRALVLAEPMPALSDPRAPAARLLRLAPCPEWEHDYVRHASALPGAGPRRLCPVTCARGDLNAILTIPRKEPRS